MKSLPLMLFVLLIMSSACQKPNPETTQQEAPGITEDSTSLGIVDSEAEEFVDVDTAAYGTFIGGFVALDSAEVEPAILEFLSHLKKSTLYKTIKEGDDFVIITPGVGDQGIYNFSKTPDELLTIPELVGYLALDPTKGPLTFNSLTMDACIAVLDFGEGIYFTDLSFKNIEIVKSTDEESNKKLESKLEDLKGKNGIEIVIKFKPASGDLAFVRLYTYKENDKLFLAFVDQHDCGA
jgi:hypothetical protein